MGIDHQVVPCPDSLGAREFSKFHAVKQCLVDSVRDTAAERGRIVVLLDFPDRHWVHRRGEGAIDSPGEGPQGAPVTRECRQPSWVVVTGHSGRVRLNRHVDDAGQVSRRSLLSALLVHRERARRRETGPEILVLGPGAFRVHETRFDEVVQEIRPVTEVVQECLAERRQTGLAEEVAGTKPPAGVGALDFVHGRHTNQPSSRHGVADAFPDRADMSREGSRETLKPAMCLQGSLLPVSRRNRQV